MTNVENSATLIYREWCQRQLTPLSPELDTVMFNGDLIL
nr:MAG TPA: hypothetical protein [Bacteriophage sp.]